MKGDITLLDGAIGTRLWTLAEERGIPRDPVWKYNLDHPDLVVQVGREYVEAGSRIICANTFGANGPSVERSSDYQTAEVIRAGVNAARQAVAGTGAKVALDAGPLSEMMEPFGDLTEEEVGEIYTEIFDAGVSAGADLLFLETFMDLEMLKTAARAAKQFDLPVFCSMTFDRGGRTMMGNAVADIAADLEALGADAIGMNCSLGPDLALPIIREFAQCTALPLIFKPNAGLPAAGGSGGAVDAETFAAQVAPALELVRYVGGCCGSDAGYIRALKALLD